MTIVKADGGGDTYEEGGGLPSLMTTSRCMVIALIVCSQEKPYNAYSRKEGYMSFYRRRERKRNNGPY